MPIRNGLQSNEPLLGVIPKLRLYVTGDLIMSAVLKFAGHANLAGF
jgi:hypothetical protein